MNPCKRLLLAIAAVTAFLTGPVVHAYVVGGPAAAYQLNNFGWTWDGGALVQPFRNALENPAYFGPAGVVTESVQTVNVDMAAANPLAGLDGFIVPWWRRDESAPYNAAIVNFFLNGGDLWLMQDSGTYIAPGRDGVGAALGVPTVGQTAVTPVNGIAPLFSGPFGNAVNVGQGGGEEGYLSEADVLANHGTVVGRNTEQQVIAAFWGPNQYAPGSGALIIVADIDMFTTQASFAPLDDNGIFALNAFAFLQGARDPIGTPAPGLLVLLGIGMAGIAIARRRRV